MTNTLLRGGQGYRAFEALQKFLVREKRIIYVTFRTVSRFARVPSTFEVTDI